MIIETIDIHGHEHVININYITHIEHAIVNLPPGGYAGRPRNPCGGMNGDPLLYLYIATGKVIEISCDVDGDDVTRGVLSAYKSMMRAL